MNTIEEKNIAVILREMIEECEKLRARPSHIELSPEDYQRLFDYLAKDTEMYDRSEYVITPIGIYYRPKPVPMDISEFMGVPVKRGDSTIILWK